MQGLLNEAQDYRDRMVEWRRNIHSCPETGFHLPKTSAMVAGVLEKLGFQVRNPGNRQAGKYHSGQGGYGCPGDAG